MPTLYTALRARHRQKIQEPAPPLPTEQVFGPSGTGRKGVLASELASMQDRHHRGGSELEYLAPKRKIAVIGAGFAGLCAAFELMELGYEVEVFEARDRVGGRVHSLPGFVKGRVLEGGGELIGSNHPLWNSYKHRFNLRFSDVFDYGNSPYRFDKKTLTADESKQLSDEMEAQFKLLTNLAETILDPFEPWTNRNAEALDCIRLSTWIHAAQCSELCKHAMSVMLAADNGIPASEQSLLAVLAMIKGGGLDRYWTDTELFRCEGGNQTLAERFADELRNRVHLNAPVESLTPAESRIAIGAGGHKPVIADDVIMAVPPSVWDQVNVDAFPDLKRKLADPPKMGSNVKFLMSFASRFWKDFASAPTLSEDGPVDLTWETTEDDRTGRGDVVMVAFSGAKDSDECRSWSAKVRTERYMDALKEIYPGIASHLIATDFMDWPGEQWTKASYYFPRPNEVTAWGPFWKTGFGGWLHFAGEHTSYAFMGYMEGALSSGYRLARRIAIRDRVLPG